jgi:hypothetical protein
VSPPNRRSPCQHDGNPAYVVDQPELSANLRVKPLQSNFAGAIRTARRRQSDLPKRKRHGIGTAARSGLLAASQCRPIASADPGDSGRDQGEFWAGSPNPKYRVSVVLIFDISPDCCDAPSTEPAFTCETPHKYVHLARNQQVASPPEFPGTAVVHKFTFTID